MFLQIIALHDLDGIGRGAAAMDRALRVGEIG